AASVPVFVLGVRRRRDRRLVILGLVHRRHWCRRSDRLDLFHLRRRRRIGRLRGRDERCLGLMGGGPSGRAGRLLPSAVCVDVHGLDRLVLHLLLALVVHRPLQLGDDVLPDFFVWAARLLPSFVLQRLVAPDDGGSCEELL